MWEALLVSTSLHLNKMRTAMSVKVKINNRNFTLSWDEFEKLVLRKTLGATVEILSMG